MTDLQAVAGISFEVHAAETVALIGRNGAGKTTSLLAIAGLRYGRFPGSVKLSGVEVSKASSRQIVDAGWPMFPRGIGYSPASTSRRTCGWARTPAGVGPQGGRRHHRSRL